MHVAALRLEIRLADDTSRRRKRRLMDEILDKLRRHFNVALAEVDSDDRNDRAILGIAAVSARSKDAKEAVDRVAEAVAAHPEVVEVIATEHRKS